MNDQELIFAAAHAIGATEYGGPDDCRAAGIVMLRGEPVHYEGHGQFGYAWDPLEDDGDALRLAAQLGFSVHVLNLAMSVSQHGGNGYLGGWMPRGVDDAADYRRAIVRGAAEIGRAL